MAAPAHPHGIFRRNRWLLTRRLSQGLVLAAFLAGPAAGVWILEGNLASSRLFGWIPLSDPFVLLQSMGAGYWPAATALIGGAIVTGIYLILGGRTFCAWVCPVNPVTDAAARLRRRLGLKAGLTPRRSARLWILLACFVAAWITGRLAWEYVNPVSALIRGLTFGMGWSIALVAAVFLFDLAVAQRGWCGHLCPMGACYGLLGKVALPRISAVKRGACTDCMDCFAVCPEPQVIRPALKGAGTPLILSSDCTTCGRCIDVCEEDVFRLTHRFDAQMEVERPPKEKSASSP